jgi:hypothetical protein
MTTEQNKFQPGTDLTVIQLPKPSALPGLSLYAALERRKTTREIRPDALPLQQVSNLLWAACGINRKEGPFGLPGRTAGSASNSQEIDLYLALPDGLYRYDAKGLCLDPVAAGDFRACAMTPGQGGIDAGAPLHLIYVVDTDKLSHTAGFQEPGLQDPEVQKAYYYVDTGLIAQNVHLYAAAHGLAAWFHNCDKAALTRHLNLGAAQHVLFAQSVGLPEHK